MPASDFTRTTARTLAKWQKHVDEAITTRDEGALRGVVFALDATSPVFVGSGKVRAEALRVRAQAALRYLGGRRHA